VVSTQWERAHGTFPLIVASPSRLEWVLAGRSLQWPLSGAATSSVALLVLAPILGVTVPWGRAPLIVVLVLLVSFASYALGLVIALAALPWPGVRNIVYNVSYLVMLAICGAQVPVRFWPAPVQVLAESIPATWGITAIRAALSGQPVLAPAMGTFITGGVWLVVAAALGRLTTRRIRRSDNASLSE
jgi:ABC-2 type transport system permease protein